MCQFSSLHRALCISVDTLHLQYFYGNGVFRSTFVGILIGPKASVLQNWFYSWINSGVQVRGAMEPCSASDLAPALCWLLVQSFQGAAVCERSLALSDSLHKTWRAACSWWATMALRCLWTTAGWAARS